MQILEELYLGGVRPSERNGKRNAQYRKALDDAIKADEQFSILMGDSPELRRQFIEQNATLVKELDV